MKVRIIGGTASGEEDLCATCRNAYIRQGASGEKTVRCDFFQRTWKEPTHECNIYSDRRVPHLHDLKEIAWSVEPSNRTKAGFHPVPLDNEDRLSKLLTDKQDEL